MQSEQLNEALPSFPKGFTASWLTRTLHACNQLAAEIQVTKITPGQVGEGVGMMSELSRLTIEYSGATQAPASIIAKYPSQIPTNREIANSYNLYEREVRYFSELNPQTSAHGPDIYTSLLDGENFVILMQDLHDYDVGDQITGATLHQTRLAITELAKLHSAFWNKVEQIEWIPGVAESYHASNMSNLAGMGWDNMSAEFADFLPASVVQLKEQFIAALPKLQARMNHNPRTLIHGDFRMENLLYGTKPEHHDVAIIDWQGPLLGNGIIDLTLLTGQSTQTEIRRGQEKNLVAEYVGQLSELGVKNYDFDTAWEDYRIGHLYNWCYVAVVSGTLDSGNARAFAWMSQMVSRQVATTLDLDLIALLEDWS